MAESFQEYRFPLFVDLRGRKAVVVGCGPIGARRARILLEFGADVTVIAPEIGEVPAAVHRVQRTYRSGDLDGAFLAVAATGVREVNRQVGQEAAEAGIFVSVADSAQESSFFFPAICTGGGLISGVVSKGREHRKTAQAARRIREILREKP